MQDEVDLILKSVTINLSHTNRMVKTLASFQVSARILGTKNYGSHQNREK